METEIDDDFFGVEICAELANELVEKYRCYEKKQALIAADKTLLGIFKSIRNMAEAGRSEYNYSLCLTDRSYIYKQEFVNFLTKELQDRGFRARLCIEQILTITWG